MVETGADESQPAPFSPETRPLKTFISPARYPLHHFVPKQQRWKIREDVTAETRCLRYEMLRVCLCLAHAIRLFPTKNAHHFRLGACTRQGRWARHLLPAAKLCYSSSQHLEEDYRRDQTVHKRTCGLSLGEAAIDASCTFHADLLRDHIFLATRSIHYHHHIATKTN